jgi:hypothetical protein
MNHRAKVLMAEGHVMLFPKNDAYAVYVTSLQDLVHSWSGVGQ